MFSCLLWLVLGLIPQINSSLPGKWYILPDDWPKSNGFLFSCIPPDRFGGQRSGLATLFSFIVPIFSWLLSQHSWEQNLHIWQTSSCKGKSLVFGKGEFAMHKSIWETSFDYTWSWLANTFITLYYTITTIEVLCFSVVYLLMQVSTFFLHELWGHWTVKLNHISSFELLNFLFWTFQW